MYITTDTIKLLRIPFSVFLSPLYFFSLSQVWDVDWTNAAIIFFILHLLIYPASNGYNSFMDRDTGSIGGLEKPPPPSKHLYYLTIVLDSIAILASLYIGLLFTFIIILYIGASKAYSYRGIRLKKYPVIGYLTVIIFQGALTFWLVYYGSSSTNQYPPWQGMAICGLLIGGFYPLTQIYQHQQDLADGVTTISFKLGYQGTFIFCALVYVVALVIMAQFFIHTNQEAKMLVVAIFFIPIIIYFLSWFNEVRKSNLAADFSHTMRMNWIAAVCTNISFITILIWRSFE